MDTAALFGPVLALVNRNLAEITPAGPLMNELEGRRLALQVRDSALGICIAVDGGRLTSSTALPEDADVTIEGPLIGLARLALGGGDAAALGDSDVTLSGRTDLAQSFQRLLKLGRPDPEEELARLIGDAAAHRIGRVVGDVAQWRRQTHEILTANLREYLQEERRELPSCYEMDRFTRDVQELRDAVARAEARLRRVEAGR